MKKLSCILTCYLLGICFVNAQMSTGGLPYGFSELVDPIEKITQFQIESPNIDRLAEEDAIDKADARPPRFAVLQPVSIDVLAEGSWEDLPNGDRICRISIHADKAKGLSLYYDQFYLPPNSQLFIYNRDKIEILGAFTSLNNKANGVFATGNLGGDFSIIEYYEPSSAKGEGNIHISHVGYVYRYLHHPDIQRRDFCDIDVACSPESDNWQNQMRGVVRIAIVANGGGYWCSGSLINNTAQDCTPYILTALHCGEDSSPTEYGQYIFYFNFQNQACGGGGASTSQSITGCTKNADSGDGGGGTGSDYLLVEITNTIPSNYNIFYNGWNAENISSPSGVGIHHPGGEPKKISTYTSQLISSSWGGPAGTHWRVVWSATTNGHGVTEGGSSGSPIFDNNGLIAGQLTGGSSFCNSPNSPDFYGKMSYNWESNPGDELRDWLDPINSGVLQLGGTNVPCGLNMPPVALFTSNFNSPGCPNDVISFLDLSTDNPTSWFWDFGDGNSSTEQSPTHAYTDAGTFDVSLTVTNAGGTDTHVEFSYIIILSNPIADFQTETINTNTVIFTDLSINADTWNWDFGDGATSLEQHPVHVYQSPGNYPVMLTVSNACGVSFHTINIDIFPDFPEANFTFDINEGCAPLSVQYFNESSSNSDQFIWIFEGGIPNSTMEENPLVQYNHAGNYSVMLIASNSSGNDTIIKNNIIDISTAPMAFFNYQDTQNLISFFDMSIDADSLHWNFGDGSDTSATNPIHTYPGNGEYIVELTAVNQCGQNIYIDTVIINGTLPIAMLETSSTTMCMGDTLFLTDQSLGSPLSWWWHIPNGIPENSIEQNPAFRFDTVGLFDVQLIVQNVFGYDTLFLENYIEVIDKPVAHYTFINTDLEVAFTNESIDGVSYQWDFGDGDTSHQENPVHTFPSYGQYVVELQAFNDCGGALFGQSVHLTISGSADQSLFQLVNIYPNPTNGDFLVHLKGMPSKLVDIEISNSQGELLLQETKPFESGELLHAYQLNLAPGLYFIQLFHTDQVVFNKIIIQ